MRSGTRLTTRGDSWEKLLDRVAPKELLGLTGTPERADGLDYERHFPRPWVGNLRVWIIPHARSLLHARWWKADLRDLQAAGRGPAPINSVRLVGAAEAFVLRAVRAVSECIGRAIPRRRAIAFCVMLPPRRRRSNPPWLFDPGSDRQHRQRRANHEALVATSTPAGCKCCAWSTSTTKASTFRTSTRCSSSARPRCHGVPPTVWARLASCAGKAELVVFDLTDDSTFSSDSIDGYNRCSATRATGRVRFQGVRAASGWLSSALRRAGPRN